MAYQARIPSTTSPKARNSTGIHLVECTFGRVPTFVETDLLNSTESSVIERLLEGERPRGIVAFDPVERWAEDVSENVAQAVVKRAYEGRILPRHTAEFCEQHVAGWLFSEVM